eukprot:4004405-Pyramimonas_sp.AAC.1
MSLDCLTTGTLRKTSHKVFFFIERPHNRNPLESTTQGFECIGKRHKGIVLERLTTGILFGTQHAWIILESLATGILRKAPQRDSLGLDSAAKGFDWKASQQESVGKRHKRDPLGKHNRSGH